MRALRSRSGSCLVFLLVLTALAAQAQAVDPAGDSAGNSSGAVAGPADSADASAEDIIAAAPHVLPLPSLLAKEAQAELFSYGLGNSDVSLMMSGFWKGSLGLNLGIAKSPLGFALASTDSPLLFTQEADLTLSLWILRRWFVEASFLDDYSLNTYRAGYQGLPGETLQYLGIGNTGLDYPVFPYMDLGGNSPGSLGFYGRVGSGDFSFHGLVRYDAAERAERIFAGTRERTYTDILPGNSLRGSFFVLPDENLDEPPDVYIEDRNGSLLGSDGRRWRMLGASEYAASGLYGTLELRNAGEGLVAVSYRKGGNNRPWDISLGSYGTPPGYGGASGFLKAAQDHFAQKPGALSSLINYPQSGQENSLLLGTAANRPGTVTINGVPALVICEKGTFSPFEGQSRYSAPSSATAEASLIRASSGERVSGFTLASITQINTSPELTLLESGVSGRLIYELGIDGSVNDRRSAERRWPLAGQYPEFYLPGSANQSEDMRIRFTNYGNAGAYSLGSDVVAGSVKVYREGLEDPRFSFSRESGIVTLEIPARFNEIIRITYLKRSSQRREGSLAAGLGFTYDPDNPFSAALGLGLRWNLSREAFSGEGITSPGTVGLGGTASWKGERLGVTAALGLGLEQPDTSSLYRINGMEGNDLVWNYNTQLSIQSMIPAPSPSLPPLYTNLGGSGQANLVYRNYRESTALGSSVPRPIDWQAAALVPGKEGPYPSRYPGIDADILVAEFSLNGEKHWTGFQTPIDGIGEILEAAEEIQVFYRLYDFSASPSSNFKLIIQFGPLRDRERQFGENPSLIVERELSFDSLINNGSWNSPDWEYTLISLREEDKRKMREATYMRVIISGGGDVLSGRVLVEPVIIKGSSSRAIIAANGVISQAPNTGSREVKAMETIDPGLVQKYPDIISRLHPDGARQRVLEVSWNGLAVGEGPGIDGRLGEIPFSNYENLSFFIKTPRSAVPADSIVLESSSLRLVVGKGPGSLLNTGDIYLDAELPLAGIEAGAWHKVSVRYSGGKKAIAVDGIEHAGSVSYRPPDRSLIERDGRGTRTMYMAFFIQSEAGSVLPASSFSLDEVILEDSILSYGANLGFSASWSDPDLLLSIGNFPVISGLDVSLILESGASGNPGDIANDVFAAVQSRSILKTSIMGAETSVDIGFIANQNRYSWNAAHNIRRSFGPLHIREAFSIQPNDDALRHEFNIGLGGTVGSAALSSDINYENEELIRSWKAIGDLLLLKNGLLGLSLNINARLLEFTDTPKSWTANYGKGWLKSIAAMAPDSGGNARERDLSASFLTSVNALPVGAVLTLSGSSLYKKPSNSTSGETSGRLDLPFKFGNYQGSLRMERGFSQDLAYDSVSLLDDLGRYGDSFSASYPLWIRIPVYSLFAKSPKSAMDGIKSHFTDGSFNSGRFSDILSFNIRIPDQNGAFALFVPNSINAGIDRTLHQKFDTLSDVLKISGSLGFSAINLFGAFGQRPVFRFYQSDEFVHSIDGVVSIPRSEDPLWHFQAVQRLGFYGFTGAELSLYNTLTLHTDGWSEAMSAEWIAPTKRSLLSIAWNFLITKAKGLRNWPYLAALADQSYEQLRKETIELLMEKTEDDTRLSLILGHESIIRLTGQLNLSVFVKLANTYDMRTELLSFIATLGTTLNISF